MRLIIALLAVRQLRLARFDTARGDLLMTDAEAAFALARRRYAVANDLAERAGLTRVRIPR